MLRRKPFLKANWKLLGPAIVMFILSTLHVSIGVRRLIEVRYQTLDARAVL